jgi:hypothetical protein
MRTVYVVVKDGIIQDAYADHLTDLVVLDYDTQDEEMIKQLDKELAKIKENNDCIEIM